jgi:hypothetical protein
MTVIDLLSVSCRLEPFFPPELEREIFEAATKLHLEAMLVLLDLFVSRRVYEWLAEHSTAPSS